MDKRELMVRMQDRPYNAFTPVLFLNPEPDDEVQTALEILVSKENEPRIRHTIANYRRYLERPDFPINDPMVDPVALSMLAIINDNLQGQVAAETVEDMTTAFSGVGGIAWFARGLAAVIARYAAKLITLGWRIVQRMAMSFAAAVFPAIRFLVTRVLALHPLGMAVTAAAASYGLYQVLKGNASESGLEDYMDIDVDELPTKGTPTGTTMDTTPQYDFSQSGPPASAQEIKESMIRVMDAEGMTDPTERAMFLAQLHHESRNFQDMVEDWGPTKDQLNYEGSKSLGNTEEGDGYKFRGRGPIQLTGRWNYWAAGKKLGLDLINNPEILETNMDASIAASLWYWRMRKLPKVARTGNVEAVTRILNGPGMNGLAHRKELYAAYRKLTDPGGEYAHSTTSVSLDPEPKPLPLPEPTRTSQSTPRAAQNNRVGIDANKSEPTTPVRVGNQVLGARL